MARQTLPSTCSNLPAGDRAEKATITALIPDRGSLHPQIGAAAMAALTWPMGQRTLKVAFLNLNDAATQRIRDKARAIVPTWSKFCNLQFDFDAGGTPDILVNALPRQAPGGSYDYGTYQSFLGTQSLQLSRSGQPSMDLIFDLDNPKNDDAEFQRVILHEFGHALGLIHEHSRPDRPIHWDVPAVVRYYTQLTGGRWNSTMIQQQVLAPFQGIIAGSTPFDTKSIMMYPFPQGLATFDDGSPFTSDWNRELTSFDQQLVRQFYGAPPDGGDGGGSVGGGGTTSRELTLDNSVDDTIASAGQRRRYLFTLSEETMITIQTTGASQVLTGELFGPDSETSHFLTVSNDSDFTNLSMWAALPAGRLALEIRLLDPTATGKYSLSVKRG